MKPDDRVPSSLFSVFWVALDLNGPSVSLSALMRQCLLRSSGGIGEQRGWASDGTKTTACYEGRAKRPPPHTRGGCQHAQRADPCAAGTCPRTTHRSRLGRLIAIPPEPFMAATDTCRVWPADAQQVSVNRSVYSIGEYQERRMPCSKKSR